MWFATYLIWFILGNVSYTFENTYSTVVLIWLKKDGVFQFYNFSDFFFFFLSVIERCVNISAYKYGLSISLFNLAKFCCLIYFKSVLFGVHKFMIVISFCWMVLFFSISCNTSCLMGHTVWYINVAVTALVVNRCIHFISQLFSFTFWFAKIC